MNWYIAALKKYAVFAGRSCRKEFWYFTLFSVLIYLALLIVDVVLILNGIRGFFSALYSLAVLFPHFAVTVRRLRDAGHSVWPLLYPLIPVAGTIVLIVFLASPSRTTSRRGSVPDAVAA